LQWGIFGRKEREHPYLSAEKKAIPREEKKEEGGRKKTRGLPSTNRGPREKMGALPKEGPLCWKERETGERAGGKRKGTAPPGHQSATLLNKRGESFTFSGRKHRETLITPLEKARVLRKPKKCRYFSCRKGRRFPLSAVSERSFSHIKGEAREREIWWPGSLLKGEEKAALYFARSARGRRSFKAEYLLKAEGEGAPSIIRRAKLFLSPARKVGRNRFAFPQRVKGKKGSASKRPRPIRNRPSATTSPVSKKNNETKGE